VVVTRVTSSASVLEKWDQIAFCVCVQALRTCEFLVQLSSVAAAGFSVPFIQTCANVFFFSSF
jgi:hypothetical protein